MPKGLVFVPFHYAEAAANVLTIAAVDPQAKIPGFKVCAMHVEAAQSTLARIDGDRGQICILRRATQARWPFLMPR